MLKHSFFVILIILAVTLKAQAAELSVFAASSLTESLREIARHYQQQHPGDRILLNFAGSQTLAAQVEQGAPADLIISANNDAIERLQRSALVSDIEPLLGNRLVLATRPDLQGGAQNLNILSRPGLMLVIGGPHVPIGRYTQQLFDELAANPEYGADFIMKVRKNVVSEENKVKAIVAKLLLGEADAGFIYRSDLSVAGLTSVPLPDKLNPHAVYPLAKISKQKPEVESFYTFLLSKTAEHIFDHYGFLTRSQL